MGREHTVRDHDRERDEGHPPRPAPGTAGRSAAEPLLQLQRAAGNRSVTRLVQARPMVVGAVHDPAELEADRVAAEVVARLEAGPEAEAAPDRDDDRSGGLEVRRRPGTAGLAASGRSGHGLDGGPVSDEVAGAIDRRRSSGAPLPGGVRRSFESAFGADFGAVRVHADGEADRLNRSLNAVAFTTGTDVFFSRGAYQPHSSGGTELLAHELTHVVQQGGAPGLG